MYIFKYISWLSQKSDIDNNHKCFLSIRSSY